MRPWVRLLILCVADTWALVTLRPDVVALTDHLAQPRSWTRRTGLDAAIIELGGALIWLLSLWLALGLLAVVVALGTRGPGALGRSCEHVARAVLPRSVYRLIAGAAGFGILLAPVAAGAATPAATAPAAIAQVNPVSSANAVHAHAIEPVPAPTWPTSPTTRSGPTQPPSPTTPDSRERVVVRPGDSLWLIAASRLGPHPSAATVAAQWPRWYAANRTIIGADPNLIQPGQVLHAPDQGAS